MCPSSPPLSFNVPVSYTEDCFGLMHSSFSFFRSVLFILLGVLFTAAGPVETHAQSGMRSVSAVGSGGGTSALDTGPSVMYSNPADLTVGPVEHNVEIQLFRIGAYVGGDIYQFNHYKTLFVEDRTTPLSNDRETSILNDWFGDSQRSASTYAELTPVAFTYRPDDGRWAMGLGVRGRTVQKSSLDKGLFDLLLRGTSPNRSVPINGESRVYSTVDVKGAFSYRLSSLPLSIGVSPSVIFGFGYSSAELNSTAKVRSDSLIHRFDYTAQAAGAPSTGLFDNFNAFSDDPTGDDVAGTSSGISGIGGGIDLGATYTIRPDLHASMSITDLGFVRWTQDAQTVTPENNVFRFEGIDRDQFNGNLSDRIETKLDSLSKEAYEDVNRDRSAFTTGLPTTLHLSSTWDQGIVILNGGLSVGLNNDAGVTPDPVAVHVGSKLDAGPIPLHFGVRAIGQQAITFSGGFGLDLGFYNFELGASVTPSTSTLGSGARYAVSLSLGTIRI